MIEILSISVAILAVVLVGLVIYIFRLNKEKQFVDKDNDPDFIKLQKDYEGLEKEKNLKDDYISDLKKDKQELIQSRTDVDSFKEISNKSFQEYQAVVSEYKNFHEKLTGDAKYQGRFNELKLRRILEKHGLKEQEGDFEERKGISSIKIDLKYFNGSPVIKKIKRISKPGIRKYSKISDLTKPYGGLGISILSTPKGVMSDQQAKKNNVGGEVLCEVF